MATRNTLPWMVLAMSIASGILSAPAGGAAELRQLEISNQGNRYDVRLEAVLDTRPEHVMAVLTDYRHIYRLNPSIMDSRLLPAPDTGVARVLTRLQGCVLFYCSELTRVEDIRENGPGELVADIVPRMSDFGPGATVWRISRHGRGSRLAYESKLQPDTFIPPLIGSLLFRQMLREEILKTMQRIECNAMTRQMPAEPEDDPEAASQETARHRVC